MLMRAVLVVGTAFLSGSVNAQTGGSLRPAAVAPVAAACRYSEADFGDGDQAGGLAATGRYKAENASAGLGLGGR